MSDTSDTSNPSPSPSPHRPSDDLPERLKEGVIFDLVDPPAKPEPEPSPSDPDSLGPDGNNLA
jgi:hypothetical protein